MLGVSRQSDERGDDGAGGRSRRSSSLSTFRPLSTLSELRVGKPQLSGEISAELPLSCVSLRAAPQSADPTTYLSDSEEQQASCQHASGLQEERSVRDFSVELVVITTGGFVYSCGLSISHVDPTLTHSLPVSHSPTSSLHLSPHLSISDPPLCQGHPASTRTHLELARIS